jgi:hypothetical protein
VRPGWRLFSRGQVQHPQKIPAPEKLPVRVVKFREHRADWGLGPSGQAQG